MARLIHLVQEAFCAKRYQAMPTIDLPSQIVPATLTFVECDKLEVHPPTTCVKPMSMERGYIDPSCLSIRQTHFSANEEAITDCASLQRSDRNKPNVIRTEAKIVSN